MAARYGSNPWQRHLTALGSPMYGLLIVPPARDVTAGAQALAQVLGGTAYDQRQPLLRGLPWLAAWDEDVAATRQRAAQLQAVGVAAYAIARAALDIEIPVVEVRNFTQLADGLAVSDRQQTWQLRWQDVRLALPCRADFGQLVTTTTTTKKVGLVQAAMGVPIAQKKTETEQNREQDQTFFCLLWVVHNGVDLLLRLEQQALDYNGLQSERTASSTSNYLRLLEKIQHGVGPVWDNRLERAGGKIAPIGVPSATRVEQVNRKTTVATTASTWDTAGGVLQAARLLMLAARLYGLQRNP